jgi:hypothetical protein
MKRKCERLSRNSLRAKEYWPPIRRPPARAFQSRCIIVDANHSLVETAENWNAARDTAQAGAKKQQLTGSSPRTDLIAFAVK